MRWHAGTMELLAHPDIDAERVRVALGGYQAGCVELARAWHRHVADLSMLALGTRGPSDTIMVTWETVAEAAAGTSGARLRAMYGIQGPYPFGDSLGWARQRMTDVLSLLALGPEFGRRLAGHVAAAHAGRLTAASRPPLRAALEGRLAPAAARWLGIPPAQLRVTLHQAVGWGAAELTGEGQLRMALPVTWLAEVWACGLELVGGRYLVVAVPEPGWPRARVLALTAPDSEPADLWVHGTATTAGTPDWHIT